MKRFLITALTISAFCAIFGVSHATPVKSATSAEKRIMTVPIADAPKYAKRALVIGIDHYQNVQKLTVCGNDAKAFADLLKKKFGFTTVTLLTDDPDTPFDRMPTASNIRHQLIALRQGIVPGQTQVVLFYSGHGVRHKNSAGADADFLVPIDADVDDIPGTCIDYTAFKSDLETKLPARALLIMDACRNLIDAKGMGAGSGFGAAHKLIGPQIAELLSCQPTQVSREGLAKDFSESVFTHFLIQGLEGDKDAVDPDKHAVTFDSLKLYLQGEVSDYVTRNFSGAAQVPDGDAKLGSMVLARYSPSQTTTETPIDNPVESPTETPVHLPANLWRTFHANAQHTGLSDVNGPSTANVAWARAFSGEGAVIGANGVAYLGSNSGQYLYAINKDGSKLWSFQVSVAGLTIPCVGSDGTIYVGANDKCVHAVTPDGKEKWSYATDGNIQKVTVGPDDIVYAASADRHLYAINADGTKKWAFAVNSPQLDTPAIGTDGTVYLGETYGTSSTGNNSYLYAINPDGSQKWATLFVGQFYSSPAIAADGTIYIGQAYGQSNGQWASNLYAVNPDGSQKWAYNTGSCAVESSPAIGSDGTIYVGTCYPTKNVIAVNPDGTLKWSFNTGGEVYSAPAIGADGTVYVASNDGHLHAIASDGTENWDYDTKSNASNPPTLGENGMLYYTAADRLIAFGN